MSLRTKLILLFTVLAIIPLGIAGRTMIQSTRDELKSSANDELSAVANQMVLEIEEFYLYSWLAPTKLMKNALEDPRLGVNEKLTLLQEGLKEFSDIVALQVWVEGIDAPMQFVQENFAAKVAQSGDTASVMLIECAFATLDYNAVDNPIFSLPLYLEKSDVWIINLRIHLDETTFGRRSFLSAWIDLNHLNQRIESNPFNASGTIAVMDSSLQCLFSDSCSNLQNHPLIKDNKSLHFSESKTIAVTPVVKANGEKMLAAVSGFPALGWVILIEKSEAAAYSMANQLMNHLLRWVFIGLVIAVLGAIVFSVSLTRPLRRLSTAANSVAAGDLSTQVPGSTRKDEIGELSVVFNKMVNDLNRYIEELTETTKAKERAESELKLAWNIQKSFLPKSFPDMDEIEVFGTCDPARNVGGDYFDFFRLDEDNFGLVIGDVSGKGVPASLFMAVSRTLFRIISAGNESPDHVLTEFNDRLVSLNEETNMFITMFYAVYNVKTGNLSYSSAGHNMPFMKSAVISSDGFEMLPQMATLVAGMLDGIEMQLAEVSLKPGDCLVLYTDGMTEAINNAEEEFGEDRLKELLDSNHSKSAEEVCEIMVSTVKEFQEDREQFDDITVFVMKVK